ncbi:hypothetical protein ACEQPO_03980 [Bacillus sp. SL00103]
MKEWRLVERPITEKEQIEAFCRVWCCYVLEEWIREDMTIDAGKLVAQII